MSPIRKEMATLGGGCFWCLEAVFEQVDGVESVVSGYAGGAVRNPTYEQVCAGETGHAEVVQVGFDPKEISYRDLLEIFFTIHDPTTLNRQGADVGPQYRSVIFHHSPDQKRIAEEVIHSLQTQGVWKGIATQVVPFESFHPAEVYHQGYYRTNSSEPYCRAVISPKLAKFRSRWKAKLKATP